jgi:hypothetical protein
MAEPENGRPQSDTDRGTQLAAELVRQLAILNENMEANREIFLEIRDGLDELAGHHEVVSRAMELLLDQADEGKLKWSLRDLASAMVAAADEIMPAEDEPGDEDPRVRATP